MQGCKYCISVVDKNEIVGVAMVGRPIARHFDDGFTVEINRTCTFGRENVNSMLYGAARRAAWALGYTRIITYTQADESGASLRAAGFVLVRELRERESWYASSSPHGKTFRDPVGTGGVPRKLWECVRAK